MWSLSLITKPPAEPLTLETEVLQHCRLEDLGAQEVLLVGAIEAARSHCETFTHRQLITATWELWMDSWCEEGISRDGAIFLPRPPLASVVSVKYLDPGGVLQTWTAGATGYLTEIPAGPQAQRGRVFPAYSVPWPVIQCQPGAIKIRFTSGYGADSTTVPGGLRAGMLLEVGEMYERREMQTIGTITSQNSLSAERLWWPFRAF